VNSLEQDALDVLSLIRSVKNSFAPINRIPPEVLLLIPDYYDDDTDQGLIVLTHVCRGWRDVFISRSSLWTQLDCVDFDKTRTYIQRSKSSPLEIFLKMYGDDDTHIDDAFLLVTPHIHRIKSLTIHADAMPDAIRHLCCHTPLLEELDIDLICGSYPPVLDSALFEGDLSSLRELSLGGVITCLPWNNLANLTNFNLNSCHPGHDFINLLLDFLKNAPLLRTIMLEDSIPESSNAPPGRMVSLPHLRMLAITAEPAHSILLNHLCIPIGASLILESSFNGGESPLRKCLPETTANLGNLAHITAINLRLGPVQKFVRMNGPSGKLRVHARWGGETVAPCAVDRRILRSLDPSALLSTSRLAVTKYNHPRPTEVEKCPVFGTLSSMNNLRTLVLTKCNNLPFILALNPKEAPSNVLLCPNLEGLVLYIKSQDQFHIKQLISMAKGRVSRDAKLSSITIVGVGELAPGKEVFKLREHIKRVDYWVDDEPPDWDDLPGESSDESV